MNTISQDEAVSAIHLLVEGNSIRSTERLTGMHRDTIMRLLLRVGDGCRELLDERMRGLRLRHVQVDEIWTFCRKKQARIAEDEVSVGIGDQYVFVAFDQDTKLIPCYALGKRNSNVASAFMNDLAGRIITETPQLSTDGWNGFKGAVLGAFGFDVNYGQIIKDFAESPQPGRYGPPIMTTCDRRQIIGAQDINLMSICTSHVERNNLTIRTFMKRFTRLSLGFSKKLENLAAAVALHVAHYDLCRVHRTLRTTPAMAAKVTDHVWDVAELLETVQPV